MESARFRNPNDQIYLLVYVRWHGAASHFKLFEAPEIVPEVFRYDLSTILLGGVSSHLKRNFPLRIHPDWPSQA